MSDYPVFQAPEPPEPPEPPREPLFPPLMTGHRVDDGQSAFARAVAGAHAGTLEAGDFLWSSNANVFDTAIVLEPDIGRERLGEFVFVAQVAFAECFGAISPPEVALTFEWPATLRLNGGRIGDVRLVISDTDDEHGAPMWMVAGLELIMRHERYDVEPGNMPDVTTFEEEGCGDIAAAELVESYARHLMAWLHTWREDGFRPIHEHYLFRADGYNEETELGAPGNKIAGTFIGLDEHGGALMKDADGKVHALDAAGLVPGLPPQGAIGAGGETGRDDDEGSTA